jgi:hypothetical protein
MRVQADTERDGSARELLRSGVCGLYRDGGVSPVTWGHGRERRLLTGTWQAAGGGGKFRTLNPTRPRGTMRARSIKLPR